MPSLSFQLLPGEVWSHILANFSRIHHLCSVSLVSKDFQLLALPHLYRTVYSDHPAYLERLALRIAVDDTSVLSVRRYVKSLFIGRWTVPVDKEGCESKKKMEELKNIVSVLPHLWHLSLEFPAAPQDLDIWKILRVKCTELRSFKLFMLIGQPFFYDARNARILDFRNLSHFSFNTAYIGKPGSFLLRAWLTVFTDFHFEVATLQPLLLPLRNSPNLQSLELNLDQYPRGLNWLPNELFSALDDMTFPHLHTFRVFGDIDPYFYSSFEDYRSNSLGRFFSRHSGLRTLGLGCNTNVSNQIIDPRVAEVLFPSLTHLEAPYFVCGSIMDSMLVDQLEDLKVTTLWGATPDTSLVFKTLPKLRKLSVDGKAPGSTDLTIVGKLLSCTPGLEELVCDWQLEMPDQVLPVLSIVPGLRILGVGALPRDMRKEDRWHEHVPILAEKCPKLRRVNRLRLYETSWEILRGEGGTFSITESPL